MHATLEVVSSQVPAVSAHPNEGHLKPWKHKVRELAYDAEDTIDKYLIRVSDTPPGLSHRPWTTVLHAARRCKARRRIATEIERIKNDVKDASERRQRFSIPDVAGHWSPPRTTSPAVDSHLPLRYDNTVRLVGTQKPNVKFVLGRILRQVSQSSGENHELWAEEEIIGRIRDLLEDKRYFIVIDDVWDESVWNWINCALVQNTHGSKVLTTTRKFSIARLCRSTDCVDATILELQPLSFLDAQNLFYNKVFGEDRCPSEFTYISDQFLRKCAGVPLAIVTIASLLTNKHTVDEWSSVYNSISAEHNSHLEDMRRILSLSYHDLPSKLKPCLLYLSLFPEDHKIEKDDLIWRWIGEGFVHAKQDMSLYRVGEDYFNELINRSLVQPVHFDAHGRVQACRVHDIVLDYINNLSLEENFVTIYGQHTELLPNKVRRLSLRNSNGNTISQEAKSLFHVRSLTVFGHVADLILPFRSFQVLRVLDLEVCSGHKIEDICNLVHLRYLRLSGAHCVEVPKQIGNLQFLQTLDLKKTKIKALPSTLVQLRWLARLCVDRLTQLPEGIGSMPSLEEVSEVDITKYPNLMEGLGKLCKLRVLKMSLDTWDRRHREPLLKCLCNIKQLQVLHIFAADVSLDFMLGNNGWSWTPPHLRRLTVSIAD
ncbi:hypothetical protein HU200_034602 [Digitaria exilis]|uniref:NB-ARC domain-containing protein n=1 Tax=Digitaria exilis TaxID=1010633 RepID=A0A835BTU0_9POAL|nr:hypothetical protein HU200_034602 [Digitaria exilis]